MSNLTVDGVLIQQTNDAVISGGVTRQDSFTGYNWVCSGASDNITVCADSTNLVPESDESNNCLNETWDCPLTPPITKTVTLKYKLTYADPDVLFNCSIWTNISGAMAVTKTQNNTKPSSDNKIQTLMKVPEGSYRWTVNCSDGVHNVYPLAANAPRGEWIYYVKAP
jgi:subtilase family serine protease